MSCLETPSGTDACPSPGLKIENLCVSFFSSGIAKPALEDLSLNVNPGEIVGFVGESGSGKSVTALSIMGLLPPPPACRVTGSIFYNNQDVLAMSQQELRHIRGVRISMIPQDPVSALNPVFRVGDQIAEIFRVHKGLSRKDSAEKSIATLKKVGVDNPAVRAKQFPHELSGGLNQRALIAMAIACGPEFLLADEPTSSLDVTVEAKILDLLLKLREDLDFGVLFITHNLAIIDPLCSRVVVLYSGQVVEEGPVKSILNHPSHPYTESLLRFMPGNPDFTNTSSLKITPKNQKTSKGCIFSNRCSYVKERCLKVRPEMLIFGGDKMARCHFPL